MIRRGRMKPHSKLYNLIGLLGTAGVLPEENVTELGMVTERTLRRYRKDAILDVVPTPPLVAEKLAPARLWTLGAVGLQLAKMQFDLVPTGYLESKIDNISHDVLCNCIYMAIHSATKNSEFTAILKSRYEVSLTDFRETQILQPDAMITLKGNGKLSHFLVEYHNENYGSRAAKKVEKYEHVRQKAEWEEQWHVPRFPPILVVMAHKAVWKGYKEEIEERSRSVRCNYLVKSLDDILTDNDDAFLWYDMSQDKMVRLEDFMY